jgi:hypothetical protein
MKNIKQSSLLKAIIIYLVFMSTVCAKNDDKSTTGTDNVQSNDISSKEAKEIRKEELKSLLIELLTADKEKKKETKPVKSVLVFQRNKKEKETNSYSQNKQNRLNTTDIKETIKKDNIDYPFKKIIIKNAVEKGIDPLLVRAVIHQESRNNINAISPKKAKGLMQLMDGTAKRFNVSNSFDPNENIRGGVSYLRILLNEFKLEHALAAYNAGEGAVRTWGGIPPYDETQDYVKKVMSKYWEYKYQTGTTEYKTVEKQNIDKPRYQNVSSDKQRQKSKLMVYSFDEVER